MSKKMDWRIAGHAGKRTLSTKDEAEYRGQDAASRWLERNDKRKGKGTKATPSQNIGKGCAPFVKNVSAPAGKPEHFKAAAPASQPEVAS